MNHSEKGGVAMKKWCAAVTVMVASLCLLSPVVHAQGNWPTKPVKIIVPFPPGGSVDQLGRILSAKLTAQLGQQFIVENKTGASGSIGTAAVASSPPDGHTFGLVFDTHAVNPSTIPKMPFDTLKDLASVMLVSTAAMAIVAHEKQPYKDFRDLLAAAKKKPKAVAYGSVGTGSLGHLAMTQVGEILGIEFNHIPYRGGGPLMNDAVNGQVPVAIATVFVTNPHVQSGKVRALGVTSAKPTPQMPGVKPIADQGVPNYSAVAWWGVIAPGKTPPPVINRIYEEINKALKDPGIAQQLSAQGMDLIAGKPAEFDKFLKSEIDRWAKVVRDNKIALGD
jgi:tripartite-type tricarboxylate transporter receptor subunit TctC